MLFVIQVSDLIEIPSTAKKNRLILHRYPGWKLSGFKERFVGFYLSMEEHFFRFQLVGR